jgi:hypothetical protein
MRLSGLQKDVLSLYRALLKSAFAKSATEESWSNRMREPLFLLGKFRQLLYCIMFHSWSTISCAVKKEFRDRALSVPRNDFRTIEQLLRYGYKQKKLIDMPGFKAASTVSD